MILETAKQQYKNQTAGYEFKHLHWWEVVRHQPKWRVRSTDSSTTDPFISSSDHATEEEVTHPICQDRANAAAGKGKGKEDSSSQSKCSSALCDIMSTLKKLSTSFVKAQLWKQYNKLEGSEKVTRGGSNESQSKFLNETWVISQNGPNTHLF
jgi:hypothetical protein